VRRVEEEDMVSFSAQQQEKEVMSSNIQYLARVRSKILLIFWKREIPTHDARLMMTASCEGGDKYIQTPLGILFHVVYICLPSIVFLLTLCVVEA